MVPFSSLIVELFSLASKEITGQLLSVDQINAISKSAVGKYFSDLLPTPENEIIAANRVDSARLHVEAATKIILEIKDDLDNQSAQLERMIAEIETKKNLATHYDTLTRTSKKTFDAFRKEMEDSIRVELTNKLEEGKTIRRIASVTFWIINLLIGAAVGAYYSNIEAFARSVVGL